MTPERGRNRLEWRCRRGLLELDLMLRRFLDEEYDRLGQREREVFEKVLETPDPTLLAWIGGAEQPEDAEIRSIVKKISK